MCKIVLGNKAILMCFVDFKNAHNWVLRGVLMGIMREYRVPGSLLQAIQSLYDQSKSCVCMLGTKTSLFPVTIGPNGQDLEVQPWAVK